MSNDPTELLLARYADRAGAARARKADGRIVVGTVGNVIPLELIIAAQAIPLTIAGRLHHLTPKADEHMGPTAEWESRSIFEAILDGDYDFVDLIIVARGYRAIYYGLKEVFRQGKATNMPPLYLCDIVQTQNESLRTYNRERIADLEIQLQRLSPVRLTDSNLSGAIKVTNERRKHLRELLRLRGDGEIAGLRAFRMAGAANFMDVQAYNEVLSAALRGHTKPAQPSTRPRVVIVSAETLHHDELHRLVEAAEVQVVGEDDWWGARSAHGDIDEYQLPRDAILTKYFLNTPSSLVSPRGARQAWFVDQVTARAMDGVIFYIPPTDRAFGWDYPDLRRRLDDAAIPSCLIGEDVKVAANDAAITAAAAAFATVLRAGSLPAQRGSSHVQAG